MSGTASAEADTAAFPLDRSLESSGDLVRTPLSVRIACVAALLLPTLDGCASSASCADTAVSPPAVFVRSASPAGHPDGRWRVCVEDTCEKIAPRVDDQILVTQGDYKTARLHVVATAGHARHPRVSTAITVHLHRALSACGMPSWTDYVHLSSTGVFDDQGGS